MHFKIAIVGSSRVPVALAVPYVRKILSPFKGVPGVSVVSGGAAGVDSAAKLVAVEMGFPFKAYLPTVQNKEGYRARNHRIAAACSELWSLATPVRDGDCYHCKRAGQSSSHNHTGGCWTGLMTGRPWNVVVMQ